MKNILLYHSLLCLHGLMEGIIAIGCFSCMAWSAFPYEKFNGVFAKLYHGTQHIAEQNCDTALRIRHLRNQAHVFGSDDCDPAATRLFLELTTECRSHRIIEHDNGLKVCGAVKEVRNLPIAVQRLIQDVVGFDVDGTPVCYNRFIYKRKVFTTSLYTRAEKRINHFVLMENGVYIIITHLLFVQEPTFGRKEYVLLGKRLQDLDERLCESGDFDSRKFFTIVRETADVDCFLHRSVKRKMVSIEIGVSKICLVKIVNSFETD
ncbi:hypothetical protein QAD02_013078 [Eretmocerus hayati]|uniref:Uncharacterized protein n=1 Tax=Eretmocerus hayati TaxID=131215 RepID=A0ACC2P3A5_9HYME|nr:hypothetical protein QAD02_013078 [Eretmocerus hayati]